MALLAAGLALIAVMAGCASSYKPKLVETRRLVLFCDRELNAGQKLPVDIVYVPLRESLVAVTQVSVADWFEKDKRAAWPHLKAVSVSGLAPERMELKITPPAETQAIVIRANYLNVKGPEGLQLILDGSAKEEEIIFVTGKGLLR